MALSSAKPQVPRPSRSRPAADRLLRRAHRPRRLSARELRVEALAALGLLAVAVALPVTLGSAGSVPWGTAAALVFCHALASRIRLYLGIGYAMPTQLVLVPMLFMLDPALVPALVAGGLAAARLADVVRGSAHPERLLTGVGDAWHAVGPSLVFALAGDVAPDAGALTVLALALAAQCAGDLVAATAREWLGRGTAPAFQAQVIGLVYVIDACLTPVGVLIAAAALQDAGASLLVMLPLLALLAAFATERRTRIDELVHRADELRAERARLQDAIRRTGDALASGLDRRTLADLTLATATDALGADAGRTTLMSGTGAAPTALDAPMASAEDAARRSQQPAVVGTAAGVAMAQPLGDACGAPEVLTVARRRPFTAEEHALFGYLASQAAVAMENIALHDQLRRQATIDDLTGLANHRRMHAVIELEFGRARRTGQPLSLVMLDIDNFKRINDTYGHQHGDLVLRTVADAIRGGCRSTDEAARYGGEELAVVLPDTDADGAHRLAEKLRCAVEALDITAPGGDALRVTVSVGVATAAGDRVAGRAELLALADGALYEAKRSGKNRTIAAGVHRALAAAPAGAGTAGDDAHAAQRRFMRGGGG